MSKKTIITTLSLLGLFTFTSTSAALAVQPQHSLPDTAYNLNTSFLGFGTSSNPEYNQLLRSLSESERLELEAVQSEYLDEIGRLKTEIKEKQVKQNISLIREGSPSASAKGFAQDINILEEEWASKTSEFENYVEALL